jgi:hypothetical protein
MVKHFAVAFFIEHFNGTDPISKIPVDYFIA